MPSTLRPIAIHVEEAETGLFTWVLTERSGPRWDTLQTAEKPVDTYRQAMADGLLALQALVPDLDTGPRTVPATTDETPADDAAADEYPEREAPKPRRGSLFGFGPAR